jgi:hypothetical protein
MVLFHQSMVSFRSISYQSSDNGVVSSVYDLHKKSFISVELFEKPLYKIIETKDCLTDIE